MFAKLIGSSAIVLLCAQAAWASTPASLPDTNLAGTWKAETEKLPLTGDFNEQVWGKGAQSVRDITLVVPPAGEATLTVARKVIDKAGKIVPGSTRTEVAQLTIGDGTPGFATRIDHAVQVAHAERRYSDAPDDRWALDNLRVGLVTFSDGDPRIEVRFDPADGQGSFAELLTKSGLKAASPTGAKAKPR
jgi:hypothetical protein